MNVVNGKLYAINPNGTQKWMFQAGRVRAYTASGSSGYSNTATTRTLR